jgi:Co/Zn/Cd efflux system component
MDTGDIFGHALVIAAGLFVIWFVNWWCDFLLSLPAGV